ncbi:MAG: hypothetical protein JWO06_360 [Bacteroidota bacterium]|nr:hypothetical protein [Bacteroidota bacterium]
MSPCLQLALMKLPLINFLEAEQDNKTLFEPADLIEFALLRQRVCFVAGGEKILGLFHAGLDFFASFFIKKKRREGDFSITGFALNG